MADDQQVRVTFTVSYDSALKLIQLANQHLGAKLFDEIQIEQLVKTNPYQDQLIFISYRRDDSRDICGRIYDHLVRVFGKANMFRDIENILPDELFAEAIIRNAEACTMLLAVVGPTWLDVLLERSGDAKSFDFVRFEIETAIKRKIPVIPIYVNNAPLLFEREDEIPETLKQLTEVNGVVIRPDAHFQSDISNLTQKIQEVFEAQKVLKPDDDNELE